MRQINARQNPAGVHDVDEEHRTLAFDGRVIFERQDELIVRSSDLAHVALARPPTVRGGGEYIIRIMNAEQAQTSKLRRQPLQEIRQSSRSAGDQPTSASAAARGQVM